MTLNLPVDESKDFYPKPDTEIVLPYWGKCFVYNDYDFINSLNCGCKRLVTRDWKKELYLEYCDRHKP